MRETQFHSNVPKDWIKKKLEAAKEMPDSFKELGEKLFEFESNEEGRGYFLEEGFAENITRDYLAENMPESQQAKLRALLGFEDNLGTNERFNVTTQFGEIPASLKDFYINKDGEINIDDATFAGIAMRLLIDHDPSLEDALLEARSSVDGLRQVARKMHAIEKGLYMELRKLKFGQEEYIEALQRIKQI